METYRAIILLRCVLDWQPRWATKRQVVSDTSKAKASVKKLRLPTKLIDLHNRSKIPVRRGSQRSADQ